MQIRSWKMNPGSVDSTLFTGCWEYELKEGENTIPHSHLKGQEINLILEGAGLVTVGEVTHEVSQGEMIFIPHQTQHSIQNPSSPILRGLTVEASIPFLPDGNLEADDRVTLRELEEVIAGIPAELDAPQALQLIIRLFDLAGFLSEQIEHAIGLDTETGIATLSAIENKVMAAVVEISRSYEGDVPRFHRRF